MTKRFLITISIVFAIIMGIVVSIISAGGLERMERTVEMVKTGETATRAGKEAMR